MKLSLFYKYKNLITPCYFLKKEGTLNNGMKPFWWKYSDGLNQNLNPPFELNPSKRLSFLLCNENLNSFHTLVRKLFKGANYSREETIQGNTLASFFCKPLHCTKKSSLACCTMTTFVFAQKMIGKIFLVSYFAAVSFNYYLPTNANIFTFLAKPEITSGFQDSF